MPILEVKTNLTSIFAQIDDLNARIKEAALPAAQAGAEVLKAQVLSNVDSMVKTDTGRLRNAIYAVNRERWSGYGYATFVVSWDKGKFTGAPHGHLIEFGHIQRFKRYIGKDGHWYTRVRPEARGMRLIRKDDGTFMQVRDPSLPVMKKPTRKAGSSAFAAYYDPLPAPRQIPARPFLRSAAAAFPRALQATEDAFFARLKK